MEKRMKRKTRSKGDFICWCGDALDGLSQLRKHQESFCPITIRRWLKEHRESFRKMEEERLAQHEADLSVWKKEKARGVPEM